MLGAIVLVACAFVWCSAADGEPTQTVDTGLGFTMALPSTWTRGQPNRNDKFVMGAGEDEFSVIVADFGPAQTDQTQALDVYRESFLKNGLTPVTETDATVAGKQTKRFVFRLETPAGAGHAEAVLLRVGDEMFAVVVVTSAGQVEARRATIAKIFESIVVR